MHSEEYDIHKSSKSVGELYPVLLAKNGSIIDGRHRREGDPFWRTETLEHIDTEDKILLARAIANWHRRQVSREEKAVWINGLASIYQEQGLKVVGSGGKNEIVHRLMEELGVVRQTVTTYLDPEYKQEGKGGHQEGPRVPASQAIEKLAKRHPRYAPDLAKRHREELLKDPDFQAEVIQEVGREAGRPTLALDLIDEEKPTKFNQSSAQGPLKNTREMRITEPPLVGEARMRASHLCLCSQCPQEAECSEIDLRAQSAKNMISFHQEELRRMQAGEDFMDLFDQKERRLLRHNRIVQGSGTSNVQVTITEAAKLILDNL